jgi:hypothetical protein
MKFTAATLFALFVAVSAQSYDQVRLLSDVPLSRSICLFLSM